MKFLASSSYDYMKLMVMELQQKLAEVEELEKLHAQEERCKKEQRPNPFNKTDTLDTKAPTAPSSWAQIHAKYGGKIKADRDKWCLLLLQHS